MEKRKNFNPLFALTFAAVMAMPAMAQNKSAERNAQIIESTNQLSVDFQPTVKRVQKNARAFLCQLFANEESEFVNDDLEVTFQIAGDNDATMGECAPTLIAVVKNKTNKIIYLDLEDSFITRGEDSKPYYIPSETQTTTGQVNSVTQNKGAVTDALGIRGALGKLAHGTDVTKENMNVSTTVTQAVRIVSIPPRQSKKLDEQILFNADSDFKAVKTDVSMLDKENPKRYGMFALRIEAGQSIEWSEETSPIKLGAFVTYGFDKEGKENAGTVGGMLYLRKAWGLTSGLLNVDGFEKWKSKNFEGFQNGQLYFGVSRGSISERLLQKWDGVVNE